MTALLDLNCIFPSEGSILAKPNFSNSSDHQESLVQKFKPNPSRSFKGKNFFSLFSTINFLGITLKVVSVSETSEPSSFTH